jgi:TolB-like protein
MRWLTALVVAAGVFVLMARTMRESARSRAALSGLGSPVVLVSPFQAVGDDTLAKSVALSVSEAMIDSLATINGLRPVSTANETPQRMDSLVRGAEFSLIVAGSIERRGNRLKGIGRVSDGPSRIQLFSQGQQAAVGAAPVLQEDLIERIVRFVRKYVGTELRRRAVAAETKDSVARSSMRLVHQRQSPSQSRALIGLWSLTPCLVKHSAEIPDGSGHISRVAGPILGALRFLARRASGTRP